MRKVSLCLTEEEKAVLRREWRETKDRRLGIRYHAILLTQKGFPIKEIADILECGTSSVKKWIADYKREGLGGLRSKPQPGNHRKLTKEAREEVRGYLQHNPEENRLKGRFWNIPLLKKLVKEKYGVTYESNWSYYLLFYECGYSFHRPIIRLRKRDPAKVKEFEATTKKNCGRWLKTL